MTTSDAETDLKLITLVKRQINKITDVLRMRTIAVRDVHTVLSCIQLTKHFGLHLHCSCTNIDQQYEEKMNIIGNVMMGPPHTRMAS